MPNYRILEIPRHRQKDFCAFTTLSLSRPLLIIPLPFIANAISFSLGTICFFLFFLTQAWAQPNIPTLSSDTPSASIQSGPEPTRGISAQVTPVHAVKNSISTLSLQSGSTLARRQRIAHQLNEAGVKLALHGEREAGLGKLEEALAQDPDNTTVLYNLAGLDLAAGEAAKAVMHMQKAVSLNPSDLSFLNRLAEAHFADSNINEAVVAYEKVVAINPNYEQALLRLGTLYGMQKRWEAAEETLRRALVMNREDPRVLSTLGNTLVIRGKFPEAITLLSRAQEHSRTAENALALGIANQALNEDTTALKFYREALTLGAKNPVLKKNVEDLEKMVEHNSSKNGGDNSKPD